MNASGLHLGGKIVLGITQTLFSVIADGMKVYSATVLENQIYENGVDMRISGLGKVFGLGVMERPAFNTQILVVIQMKWWEATCYAVQTVSVFDNSVRALIHYDVAEGSPVLWGSCHTSPILLAVQPGAGKIFLSWDNQVYTYDLGAGSSDVSIVYQSPTTTPTFRSIIALVTGEIMIVAGSSVYLHAPGGVSDSLIYANASAITAIAAAGRHVWWVAGGVVGMGVLPATASGGCMAGYVRSTEAVNSCMQAGYGLYSTDGYSVQVCPAGTYGIRAGAGTLAQGCMACAAGSVSDSGSLACTKCPIGTISDASLTSCVYACGTGAYQSIAEGSCKQCPAGYTTLSNNSLSAAQCVLCPAGSYASSGVCVQCADGTTSLPGSHHCVQYCDVGQCAHDGVNCVSISNNFAMLTQTQLDTVILSATVSSNGGVFYTDSMTIFYYMDDCTPDVRGCSRAGNVVLGPSALGGLAVAAIALPSRAVVAIPHSNTTFGRYLYVALGDQTIRRLLVLFAIGDGPAITPCTSLLELVAGVPLPSLAGLSYNAPRVKDGAAGTSMFNGINDLEITADGRYLYITDVHNYRIRRLDTERGTVSTVLGGLSVTCASGEPHCWQYGNVYGTSGGVVNVGWLTGIGLSRDELSLYVVVQQLNAVGVIRNIGMPESTFWSVCALNYADLKQNAPIDITAVPSSCSIQAFQENTHPCMLLSPYDVVSSSNTILYVAYKQVNYPALPPLSPTCYLR